MKVDWQNDVVCFQFMHSTRVFCKLQIIKMHVFKKDIAAELYIGEIPNSLYTKGNRHDYDKILQ